MKGVVWGVCSSNGSELRSLPLLPWEILPDSSRILPESAMLITLYVPLLIWGRDKYEFEAENPGLFTKEHEAVHALIDEIVQQERLMEGAPDPIWMKRHIYTAEQLHSFCKEHHDSYYLEGWKFTVNTRSVVL